MDREDQRRRAGDVIEQDKAGAGRDVLEDGVVELGGLLCWKRQRSNDDFGVVVFCDEASRVVAGVVSVIGDQDLIARSEGDRT